jgi:hypothetical protein
VAVGATWFAVTARVAAGEDVRARVCVRPVALGSAVGRTRCRAATVPGLHATTVEVAAPLARGRVQVAVELAAESNRTRRTRVVKEAMFRP